MRPRRTKERLGRREAGEPVVIPPVLIWTIVQTVCPDVRQARSAALDDRPIVNYLLALRNLADRYCFCNFLLMFPRRSIEHGRRNGSGATPKRNG
jgi:hypothetical protein